MWEDFIRLENKMKGWKVIESSSSIEHLELLKFSLKENCGIEAVVLNKKISAYQIGIAELMVLEEDFDEAKSFLEQE